MLRISHTRPSRAHQNQPVAPVRDNPKGYGLVGGDPTCWARPSRLMEQARRQTLQVVSLLRSFLAASVRKVLHAGVLLVVNGLATSPARQGHSVGESTTEVLR